MRTLSLHRGISNRPMAAMGHSRRDRHAQTLAACPLYPESGQRVRHLDMSALCQKRTRAPQQTTLRQQARRLQRFHLHKLETLFVSAWLRWHRPVGVPEVGRYIDGRAIGQRYHRTDTRNRHQTPSHVIVPDDSQQAAMQDTDLFTEHPPDKEQWLEERSRMRLCRQQWLGRRWVGDHRRAMTVACYGEA